jgi:SAM-dependent methyltransferase
VPQNVFVGEVATSYDAVEQLNSKPAEVELAVEFLEQLAGSGRALEFAIGTGRIALPLRQRGVEVHGIEISEDMVAQMRAKPGGDQVPVVIGDMATAQGPEPSGYSLVFLVYNTISNLLEQAEQVACFRNAAAHLEPGGTFVIELYIPHIRMMPPGVTSVAFDVSPKHLGFGTYDVANQREASHHYWPQSDGQLRSATSYHRYAWPAELDLMAQIAGLRLRERWGDWARAPFDVESTQHISVWEKPGA